jgi:3-oxoisoapionate kinase
MTTKNHNLLLAFYGDDFTGSTDALEFLSRAGAKTVLFIEPPTPEQLSRYEGLDAIGVAGMSRAMRPNEMEAELRPAFKALKQLGALHVHYKVCSTFDSSPTVGSIGKAIDVGAEIFNAPFIPLLVAAPALGRYCVFGNLFARMGIGSKGEIFRLDRHPAMSKHPVTPADESDLRLHLAKQTSKKIGLIDILQVQQADDLKSRVDEVIDNKAEIVLFDGLYEEQLIKIGQAIDEYATTDKPLFSVGSSGIEMALGAHWKRQGKLHAKEEWQEAGKAEAILAVSGSCSPVTSKQIRWALDNGFAEVGLDTVAIAQNEDYDLECYSNKVVKLLNEGRSVIVHTSLGNDDVRVKASNEILASTKSTSELFGTALGRIVREVVPQTNIKRIVIAGGDTSSYAARAMGIEAVEMIAPLSPGAPLCKAYAPGSPVDGLEVNFKGGQVGAEDYFGVVLNGKFIS